MNNKPVGFGCGWGCLGLCLLIIGIVELIYSIWPPFNPILFAFSIVSTLIFMILIGGKLQKIDKENKEILKNQEVNDEEDRQLYLFED